MTTSLRRSLARSLAAGPHEDAARGWDRVRLAALAVAGVDVLAVGSIAAFFTIGGPFGLVNDLANAAVGVSSVVLASEVSRTNPSGPTERLLVGFAAAGGAISVTGTYLVVSDSTGWYLAGLVSGLGHALVGAWLLGSTLRRTRAALGADQSRARQSRTLRRLGTAAGGVMILGLAAIPGVAARIDDWELAPWYVNSALLSWLGTYLVYPIWCLRLAAAARARAREAAAR